MQPRLDRCAPDLPGIPPLWWDAARRAPAEPASHARLAADCPPLQTLRLRQPPDPAPAAAARRLAVGAWNVERLKFPEATADRIREAGLDIALLSEVDIGMARSGNRDTVADLAGALGMGHAFGVEFVELGLGDARERAWHAGQDNAAGLHGNAVLSRLPIERAVCLRLDDGGAWFRAEGRHDERRVGARCAVAARLDWGGGPLWAVAVHLESHGDAHSRAQETARLMAQLDALCGADPVVLGGDFNTAALPRGPALPPDMMTRPDAVEPLFARARAAGFAWQAANDAAPTQRTRPDGTPPPPFGRIDWIFTRGLCPADARTRPATGPDGSAISDHELLTLTLERLAL